MPRGEFGRPHRGPEHAREDDRDDEADEQREQQEEHGAAEGERLRVERPAAERDGDRGGCPEGGDVEQRHAPARALTLARVRRERQQERRRRPGAAERGERPAGEERVLEDRSRRQAGGRCDRCGDRGARGDAEQRSAQGDRADLGGGGQGPLPAAGPAREQTPSLGGQAPAQPDRGDQSESEQECAQLPADEHQPVGGDASPARGVGECRVRSAQPHRRVGADPALRARLVREDPGDVPGVQPVDSQSRHPRVDPVEGAQGREPLKRVHARREQQERSRPAPGGGGSDIAEGLGIAQRRDADPAQVQAAFVEPRRPAAADLQQLAPGRRARSRETARAHAHDRVEIVRGGELHKLPLHPQLAEENDPSRPAGAERLERAPCAPVGLRVAAGIEGQAEAVDPEAALALRQRGERPLQRLLARGESPAEHREEQREGQRDPADEQRRAQRLRAKPRGGDRQRSADLGQRHRQLQITGVAD